MIYTDGWAAHNGIESLAALRPIGAHAPQVFTGHRTVIHGRNVVNSVTGAHRQSVEEFWAKVKHELKVSNGTCTDLLKAHLTC